jgi:large subunit ribosomal protein L29
MKRKDQLKEFKSASLPTLLKKETDLNKKLFDLKMNLARGKVKNTSQIKDLRKELARVKTITFETAANTAKK